MKHQTLIDRFRAHRDENDGYCDIIWLPAFPGGGAFCGVLDGPCTDILAAYLSEDNGLSFLISSPDDKMQSWANLGDFALGIQKLIYHYIFHK